MNTTCCPRPSARNNGNASSRSPTADDQSLCAAAWRAAVHSASARTSLGMFVPSSSPWASRRRASVTCPCARQKRSSAAVARSASSTAPEERSQSSAASRLSRLALETVEPARLVGPGELGLSASSASSRKCSAWRLAQLVERALRAKRVERVLADRLEHREADGSPSLASLRTRLQPTSASRSWRKASPAGAIARASSSERAVGEDRERAVQGALARRSAAGSSSRSPREACAGAPGRSTGPSISSASPSPSARTISAGGRTTSRAATSSIASGRPSSRRQISCTDASASGCRTTPRAAASSTKSVVASSIESGSSGRTRSVERRSGMRLVARIWRSGARSRSSATCTAARREVLEVVEVQEQLRCRSADPRSRRAAARPPDSRTPSARAIALGTSSARSTGASPTRCTGRSIAAPAATSSARRLLPAPPGPVIVTRRRPARRAGASTRASASCAADEPVVEGRKARRRERLRAAGSPRAGSGATSWKSCAAVGYVLQPMAPERTIRGAGKRLVAGDVARRPRDDDLLAVGGCADA